MRPADSTTRTPVVLAQGLTKVFSDFWMRAQVRAVDNLDLRIEPGQIFGLIGPNGSGKSTTIKMILGLLHKTSGRLTVFGKPPSDIAVKKRIGFLPEESYLYQFLNSRETLDFYAKLFGYPRATRRRRIDELLSMVGLDAVAHRPVGQFSKGMQRRVGIAQALINDPEFLILDEPTSGLDPIGIRQVKDLIIDLGKRGKTILLSSHLLSEVEDVCDSMTILYGGKKRAEGTRDELLTAGDRTVIETEALDQRQAESITRYIEEREGRRILRVAPARQSLESLFMSIVERAQTEGIATSGAGRGGPTAAFLRGVEAASGEQVIAELMKEPAQPQPAAAPVKSPAAPDRPDLSVVESLVRDESATPSTVGREAPSTPRPRSDEIDRSLLDSLLGSGEGRQDGDENNAKRSG